MSFLISNMLLCLILALLIGLIVGWLLRRFSALEREAELTGEIELRDERVDTLQGQMGERDHKIVALGADLDRVQKKIPGLESTLAERDDQVMSLTMDLDGWKQKVPTLEKTLAAAESARNQLSVDLDQQSELAQSREAEIATLAAELSTVKEQRTLESERAAQEAAEFNSEITAQKQNLDSVRTELEEAKSSASDQLTQMNALQTEFDGLKLHSDALTREGGEREQALEELRASLKNQDAERSSLAQRLTALAPVAARVESQDGSIVSLNNDLRARDTTIKSLRDELAAKAGLVENLEGSERSLNALRGEMDSLRSELLGAKNQLQMASGAETALAEQKAKDKARSADADREWRARLRIAESGRQQAQADLYRRQEQIDRLERLLADAQTESREGRQQLRLAQAEQAANEHAAASLAQPLLSSGADAAAGSALGVADSDAQPAGRVVAADEREWRARIRIAESARRRAEAQAQRDNEQLRRLEAQLRAEQLRPTPGAATAFAAKSERQSQSATPDVSAKTTPSVTASVAPSGTSSASDDKGSRFLAAAPTDADDLREIKGVGKVLQKTLNSLGIYQFRQIARFTEEDIAWVDDRLKFKGRITRDNWITQAEALHRAKYRDEP